LNRGDTVNTKKHGENFNSAKMKYKTKTIFCAIAIIFFTACTSTKKSVSDKLTDADNRVASTSGYLHIKTFRGKSFTQNVNLVITLHGDLSNPDYHYLLAERIAKDNDNVIAIGMLRPGYKDPEGNRSSGVKGRANGDNYTVEVINDIAAAIGNLQKKYKPGKTFIAGHSGGAAITADLISMYPNIANGAILVSCPCDVPAFRAHMKTLYSNGGWGATVKSLSPHLQTDKISKQTRVTIIIGEKDDVAPVEISNSYYNQLKQQGIDAKLVEIKDKKHNIFLEETVLESIKEMLME